MASENRIASVSPFAQNGEVSEYPLTSQNRIALERIALERIAFSLTSHFLMGSVYSMFSQYLMGPDSGSRSEFYLPSPSMLA